MKPIFIAGKVKERKGMSMNCFNKFVATTFSPCSACVVICPTKRSQGNVVSGILDWKEGVRNNLLQAKYFHLSINRKVRID